MRRVRFYAVPREGVDPAEVKGELESLSNDFYIDIWEKENLLFGFSSKATYERLFDCELEEMPVLKENLGRTYTAMVWIQKTPTKVSGRLEHLVEEVAVVYNIFRELASG